MKKLNQRGASIAVVLVVAGFTAAMSLIIPNYFQQLERSQIIETHKASAVLIKESLLSLLDNDAAWAKIVQRNPSLNCLQNHGASCAALGAGIVIDVFNADGSVVINNNPQEGFNIQGQRCTTFNPGGGDDACFFKFRVTVTCVGPCGNSIVEPGKIVATSPRLQLQATFDYNPRNSRHQGALNKQSPRYTFNFIRGNQSGTLSKYCSSINGVFDSTTMDCIAAGVAPPDFDCTVSAGRHAWFVGFAADGTPQCMNDNKVNSACSAVQGIVAYLPDGSFRCSAY